MGLLHFLAQQGGGLVGGLTGGYKRPTRATLDPKPVALDLLSMFDPRHPENLAALIALKGSGYRPLDEAMLSRQLRQAPLRQAPAGVNHGGYPARSVLNGPHTVERTEAVLARHREAHEQVAHPKPRPSIGREMSEAMVKNDAARLRRAAVMARAKAAARIGHGV